MKNELSKETSKLVTEEFHKLKKVANDTISRNSKTNKSSSQVQNEINAKVTTWVSERSQLLQDSVLKRLVKDASDSLETSNVSTETKRAFHDYNFREKVVNKVSIPNFGNIQYSPDIRKKLAPIVSGILLFIGIFASLFLFESNSLEELEEENVVIEELENPAKITPTKDTEDNEFSFWNIRRIIFVLAIIAASIYLFIFIRNNDIVFSFVSSNLNLDVVKYLEISEKKNIYWLSDTEKSFWKLFDDFKKSHKIE